MTDSLTLRAISQNAAGSRYCDHSAEYAERVFQKFRSMAGRGIIETSANISQGFTGLYSLEMACAGVLLFEFYDDGFDYRELRRIRQAIVPYKIKEAIEAIRAGQLVEFMIRKNVFRASGEVVYSPTFLFDGKRLPTADDLNELKNKIVKDAIFHRAQYSVSASDHLMPLLAD